MSKDNSHNVRNAVSIIGCCMRKIEKMPADQEIIELVIVCQEQLERIKEACNNIE